MGYVVSHQTVRLSRGRHGGPENGACVVELASMLAGEPFGDRPRSVCPMIAAYLRAVNDLVGDDERRLLFPYAAAIVGSAGSNRDLRARTRACTELIARECSRSRLRTSLLRRTGSLDTIGTQAARAALRHGAPYALTIADWLLELGEARGVGLRSGRPQPAFLSPSNRVGPKH